jgi:hypothetical protein
MTKTQNQKSKTQDNNINIGKSFLQSAEWEKFQQSLGRKVFRIEGRLYIKMPLAFGQSYLYCPRSRFDRDNIEKCLSEARKLAQEEGAFFVRYEPCYIHRDIDMKNFGLRKFKSKQPSKTLFLDLDNSEKKILGNMKQKTRYNIKISHKKGVVVKRSTSVEDVAKFYNLSLETARRDNIKIHHLKYYENMAKIFLKKNKFAIYMAYYEDKLLCSNFMLYYDKIAYYLHGASSNSHRNLMAPYLTQWKCISDAKKQGYKWYDFWGVAPLEISNSSDSVGPSIDNKFQIANLKHPWHGITKFKLGFVPNDATGKYIQYPGCYEMGYGKKRYLLYSMFKKAL